MNDLLSQAQALRDTVNVSLTMTSPEAVADEAIRLEEMRDKLEAAMNAQADIIDQARAQKRVLEMMHGFLGTDIKKLTNLKFSLYRSRKEANA